MGGNNFTIKIPLVNQYKNLFNIEKENYDSVTHNTFLTSYLNSCGDPYISALASDLNEIYSKIEKAYNLVDMWWSEYNQNISGLENSLASKTVSSGLTEGSVVSFVGSNMCDFSIYDKKIEPLVNNVYTTTLSNESVISSVKEVTTYDLTGSTLGNNTHNVALNGFFKCIEEATKGTLEFFDRTAATIGTGVSSLIEGVGKFGEGLYDVYKIGQTAVRSVETGLIDAGTYVYSKITGNEWNSLTKKIWEETKAEVSKEHVKSVFDDFYDNTNFGEYLKERSYGFETVRSVGNGIGYIGGAVALTALTCGAGTAVMTIGGGTGVAFGSTAATTAASGAATLTVTTNSLAAGGITMAAGIGKNTEIAWNDGASLGEGLTYGTTMGAWEGFEMTLGYAINSLKILKGTSTANQVGNSISHVLADTIDGATAGGIDPLMKMIYSPSDKNQEEIMKYVNYDNDGNKINDKTWDDLTFKEKYDALFKYNGGWDTVVNNGLSAGVFSLLSEVPDVVKGFKNSKVEISPERIKISELSEQNNEKSQKIDISSGRQKFNINLTYDEYDYLYRSNGKLKNAIDKIINDNDIEGKKLLEIKSSSELTDELLKQIPDDIDIRIIGGYTDDYMNGLKSANGTKCLQNATYTKTELTEIYNEIKKFEDGINSNWNDYEKAYYAYEYLKNTIKYNENPGGTNIRGKEYDSLVSLIKGESTCIGYAYTYKELLNRMGIKCEVIGGKLNGTGQHGYNVVKIGKDVFCVDSVKSFLKGSEGVTGFGTIDIAPYSAKNNKELLAQINIDNRKLMKNITNEASIANAINKLKNNAELEILYQNKSNVDMNLKNAANIDVDDSQMSSVITLHKLRDNIENIEDIVSGMTITEIADVVSKMSSGDEKLIHKLLVYSFKDKNIENAKLLMSSLNVLEMEKYLNYCYTIDSRNPYIVIRHFISADNYDNIVEHISDGNLLKIFNENYSDKNHFIDILNKEQINNFILNFEDYEILELLKELTEDNFGKVTKSISYEGVKKIANSCKFRKEIIGKLLVNFINDPVALNEIIKNTSRPDISLISSITKEEKTFFIKSLNDENLGKIILNSDFSKIISDIDDPLLLKRILNRNDVYWYNIRNSISDSTLSIEQVSDLLIDSKKITKLIKENIKTEKRNIIEEMIEKKLHILSNDDLFEVLSDDDVLSSISNVKKVFAQFNEQEVTYFNKMLTGYQKYMLYKKYNIDLFYSPAIDSVSNQVVRTIDSFFEKYNIKSSYYGADQDATRKYIRYFMNNDEWAKKVDMDDFLEFLVVKFSDSKDEFKIWLDDLMKKNISTTEFGANCFIEYLTKINDGDLDKAIEIFENSFSVEKNNEYLRLRDKLVSQGMGISDAEKTMKMLNTTGICSYADIANQILFSFSDKPEYFKKIFGYSLFTEIDGKKCLNSSELLLDMYTFINSDVNGGELFENKNGILSLKSLDTEKQRYLNNALYLTDKFLKSKMSTLSFDGNLKKHVFESVEEVKREFQIDYKTGNFGIGLGIKGLNNPDYPSGVIRFLNFDGTVNTTTKSWTEDSGHAVFVTGLSDVGVIVSSWGRKLIIPYEDFVGNTVEIRIRHIGGIE